VIIRDNLVLCWPCSRWCIGSSEIVTGLGIPLSQRLGSQHTLTLRLLLCNLSINLRSVADYDFHPMCD
jgi:hypothetical protein